MITNETINRAIHYILSHANEDISVDDVARHCNFSKYHFSRLFKQATGKSVYEFIKRMKLEQSAFRLKVEKDRSITDISCEYGYTSSNYSSAFKQYHDLSPIEFRRSIPRSSATNPIFNSTDFVLEPFEVCNRKITIEYLPDYYVIYERRIGSYENLSTDWCAFQEKYQDYLTGDALLLERTFDDPSITDVNQCLYDICITVPPTCTLENTCTIEGGKFAVYHFKGPVKEIYFAYQTIFNCWLPNSGQRIDNRFGFERYRKIESNLYMEIDLCIPIQ